MYHIYLMFLEKNFETQCPPTLMYKGLKQKKKRAKFCE